MTAKDVNFSTIFFEKELNITTQISLLSQEEYIQKQPPEVFCKKGFFGNFAVPVPMPESWSCRPVQSLFFW